jgi:hypothetical protein
MASIANWAHPLGTTAVSESCARRKEAKKNNAATMQANFIQFCKQNKNLSS